MRLGRQLRWLLLAVLTTTGPYALANPDGATVVNGTASFTRPNANTLNIHNSRNAIINWNRFNIGKGQTTNFIQPGSNSAVLNRVLSNNPSQIYGNLNSNGKVFLVNQHGLMIGAGASINTAGFYGSTLNITNQDFLQGKLNFEGGGYGGIVNRGYIHAGPGGNVVLIAPDIENGGVIEVEDGNVVLAAGESIRITSLNDSSIEFDVQSNDDNSLINLGSIIAKQGAAHLFAGNLKHSGSINATGLVRNADGTISLVAESDIDITAEANITADGDSGGSVRVQSHHGDVYFSGTASARGETHHGGDIQILGERVGLFGNAMVDASGQNGGGEVLIGGDFQGKGDVQTATQTQVSIGASIHADAIESGDGGKVIVWADQSTIFNGRISATGGAQSGDGGFVEVSGRQSLSFNGLVDTSAAAGEIGSLLLDPVLLNLLGGNGGVGGGLDGTLPNILFASTNGDDSVTANALEAAVADILLQATEGIVVGDQSLNGGDGVITLQSNVNITFETRNDTGSGDGAGGISFANNTDSIIASGTGSITMTAGTVGNATADITNVGNLQTTGTGDITLSAADSIEVDGTINSGGIVNLFALDELVVNGDITAASDLQLDGDANSLDDGGDDSIVFAAGLTISSTTGSISFFAANGDVGGLGGPAIQGNGNLIINGSGGSSNFNITDEFIAFGTIDIAVGGDVNVTGGTVADDFASIQALNKLTIIAGSNVNLAAGSGPDTEASIGSSLGDVEIDALNLNLTTGGGSNADAYVFAAFDANGAGDLILNSTIPCGGSCTRLFYDPFLDVTSDTGVIAQNLPVAVTYSGGVDTLWSTPGNWSSGQVPLANADVFIDGVVVFVELVNGSHSVRTLASGGTENLIIGGTGGAGTGDLTIVDPLAEGSTLQSVSITAPGATLTADGALSILGDLNLEQGTLDGMGDVSVTGATSWNPPDVGGVQTVTLDGPGRLIANGGFNLGTNLDNNDTLFLNKFLIINESTGGSSWDDAGSGTLSITGTGVIDNFDLVTVNAITTVSSAELTVVVPVSNNGEISKENGSGKLAFSGSLTVTGGNLNVAAGTTVEVTGTPLFLGNGGELGGGGSFIGDVASAGGIIDIEDSDGTPGTLSITGNVTFDANSSVVFDIAGPGDFDVLAITGDLNLPPTGIGGGGYMIAVWDTVTPADLTATLITTSGSITGGFTYEYLPAGSAGWAGSTAFITASPGAYSVDLDVDESGSIAPINFFTNNSGGDWNLNTNWSLGVVPDVDHYVVINQPDESIEILVTSIETVTAVEAQNAIRIDSSQTQGSLTITGDSTQTIDNILSELTLEVSSDLNVNGTTLLVDVATLFDGGDGGGTLDGAGNYIIHPVGGLSIVGANGNVLNTTLDNYGVISGSGTLTVTASGTLTNFGKVQPGGVDNPGILTFNGDFINDLTGTIEIEISGNGGAAGDDHDQLVVTGDANLLGTLDIQGVNGFNFDGGGSPFVPITYGSFQNGFTSIFGPNEVTLTPTYTGGVASAGALTLTPPSLAQLFTWADAISGDWNVGGNWDLGTVPTIGDNAVIGFGGLDITIGANASINTFTLAATNTLTLTNGTFTIDGDTTLDGALNVSGGTLTGDGDLTLNSTFDWSGGALTGNGLLTTNAASTVSNAGGQTLSRDWTNSATGVATWSNGNLSFNSGATFTNDGTFTISGANLTLTLSSGTTFNNQNFLDVDNGTITTITSGGTFTNGAVIGVGSATTLAIQTTSGTDTGTWNIDGGLVDISGGSRTLSGGFSVASGGGGLEVSGGILAVETAAGLTLPAGLAVTVSGGTLTGAQNLVVDGSFDWTGGGITGPGLLTTNGSSDLDQAGGLTLSRNWTNAATTTWTDGNLSFNANATFTNNNTFTVNATGRNLTLSSGTTFNNQGDLDIDSVGTTTITSGGTFTNGANININGSGHTLAIQTTFGTDTGTWNIASGGLVDITGGSRTLSGGFSVLSTGGSLEVSGGTLAVETTAELTLPAGLAVTVSGGTLTGAQNLVVDGSFDWTGGGITGPGLLTTNGSSDLDQAGGLTLSRNWTNAATTTWTDGNLSFNANATFTNNNTFTVNATGRNLTLSSGTTFNNQGALDIDSVGTTTITSGGTFTNGANININGSGHTLAIQTTFGTDTGTWNIASGGLVDITGGSRTLSGGFSVLSTGGGLEVSGGILAIETTTELTLPAGLAVIVSGGTLTGAQNLVVDGGFDWTGGGITGPGSLTTNGSGSLNQAGGLTLSRDWTNGASSTITWSNGNLSFNSGATFTNDGTFTISGANVSLTLSSGTTFDNQNVLDVNNFTTTTITSGGTFTNGADIDVASSTTLAIQTTFGTDTGTWNIAGDDGRIDITGGSRTLSGGFSVVSDGGDLELSGGILAVETVGPLTLPAGLVVTVSGGTLTGTQALFVDGSFTWFNGGAINGTGLLTTSGNTDILSDGTLSLDRDWNNFGTITHSAGTLQLLNGTVVDNRFAYIANGGTAITSTGTGVETFINTGGAQFNVLSNISVQPELFTQNGTLTLNGTTLTIPSLLNGGTLQGDGTVDGNLTNTGTLAPGGPGTVGTLFVTGDLVLNFSGSVEFELEDTISYDQIDVTGQATLDGSLDLIALSGYTPLNNDTFQLLLYGTNPGSTEFASLSWAQVGTEQISTIPSPISSYELRFTIMGGIQWNGSADDDWFNLANWDGGAVPDTGDDAVIPGGGFTVEIGGITQLDALVGSLALGAGSTLAISNTSTLTIENDSTLNGTVVLTTGNIDLVPGVVLTIAGTGQLDWADGQIGTGSAGSSTLVTQAGSVSNLEAPYLKDLTWNNAGTVNWTPSTADPGFDFILDGSDFNNSGITNLRNQDIGQVVFEEADGGVSLFNNLAGGTLNIDPIGATNLRFDAPVNNEGDIFIINNQAIFASDSSNAGRIDIPGSSALSVNNSTNLTLLPGNTLTGTGSLQLQNSSTLIVSAPALLPIGMNLFADNATLDLAADLSIDGSVDLIESSLTTSNGSKLIVNSGGTLNLDGDVQGIGLGSDVINNGFTSWISGELNSERTFFNNGDFEIQNLSSVGYSGETGVFNNSGTITVTNSTLIDIFIQYVDAGGTLDIGGLSSFGLGGPDLVLNSGQLIGNGTFEGHVINNGGVINPGGQGSTGVLTINGNLDNFGVVEIDIGEDDDSQAPLVAGTDFDQLVVTGDANLGGTLALIGVDGFTFSNNGASYNQVITYNSRTANTFGTISTIGDETIIPAYTGDLVTAGDFSFLMTFSGDFIWTGGSSNSWNNADNWNFGIPGVGNDVVIPLVAGFETVEITGAEFAASLSLGSGATLSINGGSLFVSEDSTLDGLLDLQNGGLDIGGTTLTLNGGVDLVNTSAISNGTVNLSSTAAMNLTGTSSILDNLTFNNAGTVIAASTLTLQNDTVFNNGGVFDFTADVNITLGTGAASFNNLDPGQIRKTGGTGISAIDAAITTTNEGSVQIDSGELDLGLANWTLGSGDVLSGTGTYKGNVTNSAGRIRPGNLGGQGTDGTLRINGLFDNGPGGVVEIDFNSRGNDELLANDVTLDGTVQVSLSVVPQVSDSTRVVSCQGTCTDPDFASIVAPPGITFRQNLQEDGVDLEVLAVSFSWIGSDGNWNDENFWSLGFVPDASVDVILPNVNLVITDFQEVNSLALNPGATLTLNGGAASLGIGLGGLTVASGATLTNSGGTLLNSSVADVDGSFANNSGVSTFNGNVTVTGDFAVGGGTVNLNDGAVFDGGLDVSGGTLGFGGANADINGPFNMSAGIVAFDATQNRLAGSNNTWSGGTWLTNEGSTLVMQPGSTLDVGGSGPKLLRGVNSTFTLDMTEGDINMSGSGSLNLVSAVIDNTGGTSFFHQGNGALIGDTSSQFINNGGLFENVSGTATILVDFVNDGGSRVNVLAGTLLMQDTDSADLGAYRVDSGASLIFAANRVLLGSLENNGSLGVSNAVLVMQGSLTNNGRIQLANGTLNLAGQTLQLNNNASLGGSGVVQGNVVNNGLLLVGGAGAIDDLEIQGNYQQNPNGVLVVEVFNNGSETQTDQLTVTGATQLNGGALVIGFTTNSLGLVTADIRPLVLEGGVTGNFARVIDAGGNILFINFSGGVFTIFGASPKIPDALIDDLIAFIDNNEELVEIISSNRSVAEGVMKKLLEQDEEDEESLLVCK